MPDRFESDTRKQMRREHPEIDWDEDKTVTPDATSSQGQRSPGYVYGAMMRLLSSKGDFETELERFTDLSSPETRAEGRRRARQSLGRRE